MNVCVGHNLFFSKNQIRNGRTRSLVYCQWPIATDWVANPDPGALVPNARRLAHCSLTRMPSVSCITPARETPIGDTIHRAGRVPRARKGCYIIVN